MALFDQLIFNDDRNQGNMLIGKDWKVWLIDHTQDFSWEVLSAECLDSRISYDR
jgi:hypothetical protein